MIKKFDCSNCIHKAICMYKNHDFGESKATSFLDVPKQFHVSIVCENYNNISNTFIKHFGGC